jgi:hypothetical protein
MDNEKKILMLQKISGIYVSILRTRFSASSQSMEFSK